LRDPVETNDVRLPSKEGLSKIVSGCGVAILAAVVLLLVAAFVLTAFHASALTTLDAAVHLIALFANSAISFYAFAAFRVTKNRAFLSIAFAALTFGYSALFSLLLGVRPPATAWHMTRSGVWWYYATRYVADLIGLTLYAYGVISLARCATRKV
jgi:hypothetical protein